MIHLIIAESELELIPEGLSTNAEVKDYCRSRGKKPGDCLLDANYLPNAIVSLPDGSLRGRPEILHVCLLNALESDIYKEDKVQFWIHTRNDRVIRIEPKFRVPRLYARFVDLMEELLTKGQVPPEGLPSLILEKKSLKSLVESIKPSKIFILSKEGKKTSKSSLIKEISTSKTPLVIVGGFTDKDFSETTLKLSKNIYRISDNQLTAWSVLGSVVYGLG